MDFYQIRLLGDTEKAQNSWREGGMHFGVCKISRDGYATRSVTKTWRERVCIPKNVLKPELGTQNFLPAEIASNRLNNSLKHMFEYLNQKTPLQE